MKDPLTYRYPRTLDQAFGPDATSANPFEGCDPNQAKADKPVMFTCGLAVAFLFFATAMGWI